MVKGKRVGIILAAALSVLLLVTACAPAPTAPAGEKMVEVAAIEPITGVAGTATQPLLLAFSDYFAYFNEQGEIPGVSVKFLWGDTARQYSLFLSHYERFVARGVQFMTAAEATGLDGLKERFVKDEVVMIAGAAFQDMIYSPGWRYWITPTLAEVFAVVAEHFKQNWQEDRPPRMVFVGMESPWGYEPMAEGTKYAQSLGFEVLPREIVPFITLDATTHLLRLKGEEADWVYIQATAEAVGPILRDAERLGLLGQMQFAGAEIAMTEKTILMTGAASEGYLMAKLFPWFDETEVPGVNMMIEHQMKYRGKVWKDMSYEMSWAMAALACEAIKRAIEDVGYENLDGVAIKEAMDSIQGFDVYGLVNVTYKDRPLDHRGVTKVAIYEVKGGKIVRVTDWQEVPSLVPEGLIRE